MTEAALVDPAITQLHPQQQETRKPLKACVEEAMQGYFKQLEGHTTNDLYQLVLNEIEEPLFRSVLEHTRGNQSKASELLGINRGTLRKKLKMYGLND
ncbi:MAG: DNA-binding transcriptional regulator Fis [Gammaproteobacteria bacterium]|nr:DNA-binding transcriptional regulator Fis [Gammaproteobacteria bacterium]